MPNPVFIKLTAIHHTKPYKGNSTCIQSPSTTYPPATLHNFISLSLSVSLLVLVSQTKTFLSLLFTIFALCMELIPGLPNDIARECLIRIPYDQFSLTASVCKGWKFEIELPEFFLQRKVAGFSRTVVVMAQARVDYQNRKFGAAKFSASTVYRITICEPETGNWLELPPVPDFSDGLPMFCQFAGVGSNLVVMGGWDSKTWAISKSVYIYNFVSATWQRGADMPGCSRSFFGCASDSYRTVFIAGGHDGEKNALKSAMAYDVANDEWISVPDMARERDECKVIFHRGKFHVIGGYHTKMQGRFERSAEAFDASTRQWDQVQEDFLETGTCPRTCVNGGDMQVYMCRDAYVVTQENGTWRAVAELPNEVYNTAYVTTWHDKLLVIGSPRFDEPRRAYVLDLKAYTWTKVEMLENFSGHVQSGCCLEV